MGELIGTVLSAATGGGALGILGGLFRQGLEWLRRRNELAQELELLKERNRHEVAMREADRELLRLEGEAKVRLAATEGEAQVETARMNAIAASFAADRAAYATGRKAADSGWFIAVDVVRGLIRPGITVLFDAALLLIWAALMWLLWEDLARLFAARDPSVTKPMLDHLIDITRSIIFLATTTTSYWFVARPHSDRPETGRG